MSDKKEQVLEELIRFLKDERELYGDWNPALHTKKADSAPQPGHSETEVKPAESSLEADTTKDVDKQKTGESAESGRTSSGPPPQPDAGRSAAGNSPSLIRPGQPSGLDEQLKSCKTLEELRILCEESQDLKTDLEGTNLVFGVGNPNADLMLIGEAPGYYEDQQGEPFVGKAGKLLNKILKAIHFQREDVYIANILKHRPPKNRDPKPEERQKSLPYLMRQIDIIQPKLILCLGRVSATTLLEREDSLKNMRGKFHPFREVELMVTYHPAALLRHQKWKRPTWEDVQLLRKRYDELGGSP